MTPDPSIPPLRDLPPGRLDALADQLLLEIQREPSRRRLRWPAIAWTPRRLAGLAGASAAAAVAITAVVTAGGGTNTAPPFKADALPPAPIYAFHAPRALPAWRLDTAAKDYLPVLDGYSRTHGTEHGVPLVVLIAARQQARANGDRHPRFAQWVKTTRQRAVSADNAGRVESGKVPVYFVVLHGHFVARGAPLPPGAKPPKGTVLSLTIAVKTGQVLDLGLSNHAPNYSATAQPHSFTFGAMRRTK